MSLFARMVVVMKKRMWLAAPLIVLMGASACSGGTATTVEAAGTELDGVEFVVHQAPG